MIEYILLPQTIEALGWTLLHSIWQGAVFAILLVVILIALRKYSAQSRYVVSVGILFAFFLTVSATFWQQWEGANARSVLVTQQVSSKTVDNLILNDQSTKSKRQSGDIKNNLGGNSEVIAIESSNWQDLFKDYFNQHMPLLVSIWLMGIFFLQLRFLGQLAYVQRLKYYGTQLFPEVWRDRIEELEGKLRIQKKVDYLTSIRIQSPMVIGWLKPVVLMPTQLLNSLSETEIYAVLAHELAHIRREDFIVNLMQTFLCNIFFYHPGVWWMSHRIDEEREHSCDDLAVLATGQASSYAKTLINVSELQLTLQRNPELAVALSGKHIKERGGFSARIRRLFITGNGVGTFREGFTTACILVIALLIGVVSTGRTAQDVDITKTTPIDLIGSNSSLVNSDQFDYSSDNDALSSAEPITEEYPNITTDSSIEITELSTQRSVSIDTRIDALVMACGEGDIDFVKILISSGIDIDGIGSEGFTPLMMAANNEENEIVTYLLDQGADVNKTHNGWTALIEAADEGSIESMKHLIKAGAKINYYKTPDSHTAISIAGSEGKLDCLILLLENGADINGIGKSAPPLHAAAEEGRTDIVNYLIAQNVDINKKDVAGRTALMYAASEGNRDVVEKLVNANADILILDRYGASARNYALEDDHYSTVRYLDAISKSGTEVRFGKGDQSLSIHQATSDGYIEKVQRMVDQGIDVNIRDDAGRTALHIASALGHNIDVQVLIDLGADIDIQDKQGRTALMQAAAAGKENTAVLLVSRLADVNIEDTDGMTAYDWSRSGGNEGLAKFLGLITKNKQWNDKYGNSRNREKEEEKRLQNYEKHLQKSNQHSDQRLAKQQQNRARQDQSQERQRIERMQRRSLEDVKNMFEENSYDEMHIDTHTDVHINTHINSHQNIQSDKDIGNEQSETFHRTDTGYHLRQFGLEDSESPLFAAVEKGAINQVGQLLDDGISANTADAMGQTPLMIAARKNRINIARLLIKRGADVNQKTASGLTALHYTALENLDDMARLLLKNNAKVDLPMEYSSTDGNFTERPLVWEYIGATPLLIAVESSNIEVLSVLIDAGANPNYKLIRNEYILNKNKASYLSGSEVMGINNDFLREAQFNKSDDSWTPYKQALLSNDLTILDKLSN